MYERFSLFLGQALISRPRLKDLVKREEGQGITEYGMAVAFVVVALVGILALLKGHIQTFINKVGDDIENDIRGAQAAGLRGILVATGKHNAHSPQLQQTQPEAILPSLADLPAWLESKD